MEGEPKKGYKALLCRMRAERSNSSAGTSSMFATV